MEFGEARRSLHFLFGTRLRIGATSCKRFPSLRAPRLTIDLVASPSPSYAYTFSRFVNKMLWDRIVLLLAFTHLAASKQPSAPSSVEAPLRELPWGKLNFLVRCIHLMYSQQIR